MEFKNQVSEDQICKIEEMIAKEAATGKMVLHSKEEIKASYEKGDALAVFVGSELVGHISLIHWEHYVELVALIVQEDYRLQGIGSLLFEKFSNLANEKYLKKRLIVLTNKVSAHISLKWGFVVEKKKNMNPEIWQLCSECEEFKNFPNCHCLPMVYKKNRD